MQLVNDSSPNSITREHRWRNATHVVALAGVDGVAYQVRQNEDVAHFDGEIVLVGADVAHFDRRADAHRWHEHVGDEEV